MQFLKRNHRIRIPNEVWKLPEKCSTVLDILNEALTNGIPEPWRETTLHHLPKKGDLSVPGNWRGIALMQHVAKLFNSIICVGCAQALTHFLSARKIGFVLFDAFNSIFRRSNCLLMRQSHFQAKNSISFSSTLPRPLIVSAGSHLLVSYKDGMFHKI